MIKNFIKKKIIKRKLKSAGIVGTKIAMTAALTMAAQGLLKKMVAKNKIAQ